jgi:hypothetical protein
VVSEVTDLIDSYKAGELTLDELAERFRGRRWPRTPPPLHPSSYLEMAARAQEDPSLDVPNSFDDVEAAFFRHDLSAEEYELLRRAVEEALKAEDGTADEANAGGGGGAHERPRGPS